MLGILFLGNTRCRRSVPESCAIQVHGKILFICQTCNFFYLLHGPDTATTTIVCVFQTNEFCPWKMNILKPQQAVRKADFELGSGLLLQEKLNALVPFDDAILKICLKRAPQLALSFLSATFVVQENSGQYPNPSRPEVRKGGMSKSIRASSGACQRRRSIIANDQVRS